MADDLTGPGQRGFKRRTILKGAAAVATAPAVLGLLAACAPTATAPSGTSSGAAKGTDAPKGTEEIVFWHTFGGALGKKLETYIDGYNTSQKDVKVNYQFAAPSYNELLQKMLPAIASGTGPDVVLTIGITELAKSGALLRLDDLLAKNKVDVPDFNQGLMADVKYKGGTYALPHSRSTPILLYNADLLSGAGLDAQFVSSWDNIANQGAKLLLKSGGETSRFAYANPIGWWFWSQFVFSFGGEMCDRDGNVLFTQGPAVEALQYWQDLVQKSGVLTAYPAGSGFQSWTAAYTDLINQRVAGIANSTAQLTTYLDQAKFKAAVAPMPGMKTKAVPTGGSNMMILAKSKKPDAAMAFISWATSTEGTSDWHIASGYLPVRSSALASPKIQDWLKKSPAHGVAIQQLSVARPTPVITEMAKFDTQVSSPLLEAVLLQKGNVKAELDKAARLTESLWKEYSK